MLAAAGGVVLSEQNRTALRDSPSKVVWLCADPATLVERVRAGGHRPLLDDDPEGTLRRMFATSAVAACHRQVADADRPRRRPPRSPHECVRRRVLLRGRDHRRGAAPGATATTCSSGTARAASSPPCCPGRRSGRRSSPRPASRSSWIPGVPFEVSRSAPARSTRRWRPSRNCAGLRPHGLTRNDVVIALGGGMVTDLAGFAASVGTAGCPSSTSPPRCSAWWTRRSAARPRQLPEGKNLVGAFWQPSGVICDLDVLATLPPREVRCGRGRWPSTTSSPATTCWRSPSRSASPAASRSRPRSWPATSARAPTAGRAILNYGHTLAHALEIATDHSLAHGEAVAIGLIYAAQLGRLLGRIDDGRGAAPLRRGPRRLRARHRAPRGPRPRRARRPDVTGQEGCRTP